RRRGRSDGTGEQLVRQEAAAGSERDSRLPQGREEALLEGPPERGSEALVVELLRWRAAVEPKAKDQGFRIRNRLAGFLAAAGRQAGAALRRRGRQRIQVARERRGVPAARCAIEGVRTRPDGLMGLAAPVGQVVAAFVARPRPVADLVATEAG